MKLSEPPVCGKANGVVIGKKVCTRTPPRVTSAGAAGHLGHKLESGDSAAGNRAGPRPCS